MLTPSTHRRATLLTGEHRKTHSIAIDGGAKSDDDRHHNYSYRMPICVVSLPASNRVDACQVWSQKAWPPRTFADKVELPPFAFALHSPCLACFLAAAALLVTLARPGSID